MTEQMTDVKDAYEDLKITMLCAFDEGFGNGMEPSQMRLDMRAFVASTELGEMDSLVDTIFAEWCEDRDLEHCV